MSWSEQTVKCPICGRPYKVYSHTVMDQSACPRCVQEASGGADVIITTTGTTPTDPLKYRPFSTSP